MHLKNRPRVVGTTILELQNARTLSKLVIFFEFKQYLGSCKYGGNCAFAHGDTELRGPTDPVSN
jgi:hypothetical protein